MEVFTCDILVIGAGAAGLRSAIEAKLQGLDVAITDEELSIRKEGKLHKFVEQVQHLTFNGKAAFKRGQKVSYITERAVFELTENGLLLTEIAPGIELESDILAQMAFRPRISEQLKLMSADCFRCQK